VIGWKGMTAAYWKLQLQAWETTQELNLIR